MGEVQNQTANLCGVCDASQGSGIMGILTYDLPSNTTLNMTSWNEGLISWGDAEDRGLAAVSTSVQAEK